jgi:hypothetical protein
VIISFLGIHKYQTHPGFWHQYSYAKQTTKVWKTCSKLNFFKGFCECEQKKDVNSIFLGTFFLHLHSLCGITYFEPNCRMRWIFMDFLTEIFVIFHCFKYFCSKLFKKYIRLKQAFEILKSVKIYHFLFGNPWISMPSWVLVSIFKFKIDHIGAKNKFLYKFWKKQLW